LLFTLPSKLYKIAGTFRTIYLFSGSSFSAPPLFFAERQGHEIAKENTLFIKKCETKNKFAVAIIRPFWR
jgi:hypothetical protein